MEILPVRELLLSPETMERARRLLAAGKVPGDGERPPVAADGLGEEEDDEETAYLQGGTQGSSRRSDLERLAAGLAFPGMEAYLATLGGPLHPPGELIAAGGAIVICDPKSCRDRANRATRRGRRTATSGNTAAARCGQRRRSMRISDWCIWKPAMPCRNRSASRSPSKVTM